MYNIVMQCLCSTLVVLSFLFTANAQTLKGTYTLTSVATGRNLDGNEKDIYPHPANGGDHQKWILKQTGTIKERKVYSLTSVATGRRLDGNEKRLYTQTPNDSYNQKWIIDATTCPDCFTLTNLATNKRLDGNAESLYPFEQNEGNYQKWRIVSVTIPSKPQATTPSAIVDVPSVSTSTIAPSINSTQSLYKMGDWTAWIQQASGIEYRYRWRINTLAADHPQYVDAVVEIRSIIETIWEGQLYSISCRNPDKIYSKQPIFRLQSKEIKAFTYKSLNCGTADKPLIDVRARRL